MARFHRVLITGATSGIGQAFARELAGQADLLLTGRNAQRLNDVREELARPGREIETVAADLTREADIIALAERADGFGIDLLINNAGIGHLGPVFSRAPVDARDTVVVNVLAPVILTTRLVPGMLSRARLARRRCGVINLASTAAFAPVPFFATYAATKAFDLSWTEALADELRGEPVDILALCPGATRTEFGGRAGFQGGDLPGATDPAIVARAGLQALGRCTVKVTGLVDQVAFGPLVPPRRLVTGAVGAAMRLVDRVNRSRSPSAQAAGKHGSDPSS